MAIALGDAVIGKVFRGSIELAKVYLGAALIHDTTGDFLLAEDGHRITLEDGTPIELTGTIEGLAVAIDLDGTEWAFILQDGATVKARLSDLLDYFNG
jgi:hypothetical protein